MGGGRSRVYGFCAIGLGILFGIVGKAADVWPLGIPATALLIGGGVAVALSYRRELSHTPSASGFAMMARAGVLAPQLLRREASAPLPVADGDLISYASAFNDALIESDAVMEGGVVPASPEAINEARDRLMRLVANPRYGAALSAGLVDEERVRSLTLRLATFE